MKIEVIRCDNPRCNKTSHDGYGWLRAGIHYVGTGPSVEVEVCSDRCLHSGLAAVLDRQRFDEFEREVSYREAMAVAVLAQPCDCGAQPGEKCQTRNGHPCQYLHQPRVAAAREAMRQAAQS